jgi:hypothetical protein
MSVLGRLLTSYMALAEGYLSAASSLHTGQLPTGGTLNSVSLVIGFAISTHSAPQYSAFYTSHTE